MVKRTKKPLIKDKMKYIYLIILLLFPFSSMAENILDNPPDVNVILNTQDEYLNYNKQIINNIIINETNGKITKDKLDLCYKYEYNPYDLNLLKTVKFSETDKDIIEIAKKVYQDTKDEDLKPIKKNHHVWRTIGIIAISVITIGIGLAILSAEYQKEQAETDSQIQLSLPQFTPINNEGCCSHHNGLSNYITSDRRCICQDGWVSNCFR